MSTATETETPLKRDQKKVECDCGTSLIASFDPNCGMHTGYCKTCNKLNAYPNKN
jgi:hypothetical protein